MSETSHLERILDAKRAEIADDPMLRNLRKLDAGARELPATLDFEGVLRSGPKPRVIAEFKRASPSHGALRADADPKHVAALYVDAGAACISVLTDRHFEGSFDDLEAVHRSVSVPVLCKDFILSRSQIVRARRAGADAILLIVAALEPPTLRDLIGFAHGIGLGVLVETHDEREVERALAAGATMIGANARDLTTFEVDPDLPLRLRERVPEGFTFVAESGIDTREQVERLRRAGVDAILVGSHLMLADDPGLALMDLMAAP